MDALQIFLDKKLISAEVAQQITQQLEAGVLLETALITAGVDAGIVRKEMATYYNVPAFEAPDELTIKEELLELIPEESARHYKIVPLQIEDEVLLVGVNNPENVQIREVLSFVGSRHHMAYKIAYILPADLEKMLNAYESLSGEVGQALTSLENELDAEIESKQKQQGSDSQKPQTEHIEEDAPVTKIVATVLRYAVDGGASDIHIEPFAGKVRVRFRIDGHLVTNLQLPHNVQSAVVARVKILSSMRLDERRKPQDGRFSATFDGRKIDFRVSVLPTNAGEKVVMRILDSTRGVNSLEQTGISDHNRDVIRRMTQEPFGIILISGPTGSGKSTTLYSMLEAVDKEGKNVLSLEDPVEYNIEGVAQSQVRPEIGYTFAAGLRSALRQDPDIILVGEIRDKETAQLAIQAALTGHLVFSTIHTNNSIGVIPRLIDMGVDPYLIAPTLKLAVAQRLVRRLCPDSGKAIAQEATQGLISSAFANLPPKFKDRIPAVDTMLQIEPTELCPSGTKGRVAVTECLEITDEIERLILQNASEEEIYNAARKNGFLTMKEDAIIKALQHTIPFEEVGVFGTKVEAEELPEAIEPTQPVTTPAQTPAPTADAGVGAETANQTAVDNFVIDEDAQV